MNKFLLIFCLSFYLPIYSSQELDEAMRKASLNGLPEWQQAYGSFDAKQAKAQVKQGVQASDHEIGRLMLEIGNNSLSQKQQYEITSSLDPLGVAVDAHCLPLDPNAQEQQLVTRHQCYESEAPEMIVITRSLDIEVRFSPRVVKEKQVCQGHSEKKHYFYKSDAKQKEKEWLTAYSKDSTIKKYSVDLDGSILNGYDVELKYTHHANTSHCTNCKKTTQVKKEEVNEIVKEEWIDHTGNYQSLLLDPHATFIEKQCVDSTPAKTINGLLVERPCWKEQYAFLRKKTNQVSDCDLYRQKNCILLESKCVQGSDADCLLWELTFECFEPFKPLLTDAFSHQELEVDPVEPNTSFNEVVAKLSVFKAMKEEIQTSQTLDPETLEVFKGSTKQCNKSIAPDAIYDCCFAYSGLAKQIGLAQCNAEEIALATLREEGQCHYIGVKEDKLLDLVTTNYTHVYCCFPTKLARVFNEQARKQLNMGWGDAEHPNCQGLTLQQIQSLNFDQLQLEEVFDKEINELTTRYADKTKDLKDPTQAQKHIDEIKNKMKEKLKDRHEK